MSTLRLRLQVTLHLQPSLSTYRLRQVGTQQQHLSLITLRLCLQCTLHQHLEQVRLKKPSGPVEFRRAVACCADLVVGALCGSSCVLNFSSNLDGTLSGLEFSEPDLLQKNCPSTVLVNCSHGRDHLLRVELYGV